MHALLMFEGIVQQVEVAVPNQFKNNQHLQYNLEHSIGGGIMAYVRKQ